MARVRPNCMQAGFTGLLWTHQALRNNWEGKIKCKTQHKKEADGSLETKSKLFTDGPTVRIANKQTNKTETRVRRPGKGTSISPLSPGPHQSSHQFTRFTRGGAKAPEVFTPQK